MAKALRKNPLGLRVWLRLQNKEGVPLFFDHPSAEECKFETDHNSNSFYKIRDSNDNWVATYEPDVVLMIQPIADTEEKKSA